MRAISTTGEALVTCDMRRMTDTTPETMPPDLVITFPNAEYIRVMARASLWIAPDHEDVGRIADIAARYIVHTSLLSRSCHDRCS